MFDLTHEGPPRLPFLCLHIRAQFVQHRRRARSCCFCCYVYWWRRFVAISVGRVGWKSPGVIAVDSDVGFGGITYANVEGTNGEYAQ